MPDRLEQAEYVRAFALIDEGSDIGDGPIDVRIDLVPIERARRDHLLEAALGDALNVGKIRGLRTVMPVDENQLLGQRAEEFGMARERIVPNHRPPAAVRDHEVCRVDDVLRIDRSLAARVDEVLGQASAEIRRFVGPDVKKRRVVYGLQFVADQIAHVRFAVGVGGREQIPVRQLGERRVLFPA